MRDASYDVVRDLAAFEEITTRLKCSVQGRADLLRPDVLALSRKLDAVTLRLQRHGYVRRESRVFRRPEQIE